MIPSNLSAGLKNDNQSCVLAQTAFTSYSTQVSVSWSTAGFGTDPATPGVDFRPMNGTITFAENVTSVALPLRMVEDSLPEFAEKFTVQLYSPVGGARIGSIAVTTVTIAESDDPNGAFGRCQLCVCVCVCASVRESGCVCICACVCIRACMCVHVCACMCVPVCECVRVCVYVC